MKGTIKLLSVLMIAIMLVSVVSVPVHATGAQTPASQTPSDIVDTLDTDIKSASGDVSDISEMAGKIIKWIRNVAVIAGVLLLTVLGFKYMLGSAEEKADYKKSLIPLVIGIIVVMASTQVISMIFDIF